MTAARLRSEQITGLAALQALRPAWVDLWERAPDARPFQHPDWLLAYCEPFGVREPRALALWEGERLVGVIPLVVYLRGDERVATLLGAGISDYQDALLEAGSADLALTETFAWLERARDAWDTLELEQLSAGSPLLHWPAPPAWASAARATDVCPVLDLPGSVEGLLARMSPHLRENVRYYRRRAERTGEIHYEAATPGTLDDLFGHLLRLHRARWALREEPGVLPPRLEGFHRQVARAFQRAGLLRLYALRVGDRVAAVWYGFAAHGRAYYYLSGWDPAFERLSPGTLIVAHAVEEAVRNGERAFDFLRGREAYKYAWGAQDTLTFARRLTPAPALAMAHAG